MKSMARAILFTSFVAAATAAVGDKLSSAMGEPENQADASTMPTEPQASDAAMTAEAAPSTEVAADGASLPPPSDYVTVTPSPSTDIVAAAPPPAESVPVAPRPTESVARRTPARAAYDMTVAWAFPGSADDAGYRLPAKFTHADYANAGAMTAASAFPGSYDDAGRYLIASRTHADMFLDRSTRVAQSEQRGAVTGGN